MRNKVFMRLQSIDTWGLFSIHLINFFFFYQLILKIPKECFYFSCLQIFDSLEIGLYSSGIALKTVI